jgi:pilus assembly protein CpaF
MIVTVRRPGDPPRMMVFAGPEVILGKQGDVVLDDVKVSRRHALLKIADGKILLRDLGSTNGTRVGGTTVTDVVAVGPEDGIEIGPFTIQAELEAAAGSAPEPRPDDTLSKYGPLAPLLADDEVSEIMVNGPDEIFIERGGKVEPVRARFESAEALGDLTQSIAAEVGRPIDMRRPLVDCRLPDGSRVNAVLPPLALRGPYLTIRRFPRQRLSASDLIELGSISLPMLEFLRAAVAGKLNILISGGTGSGKTTMLNTLCAFVGPNERIVTIEDAAELRLPQRHVLPLEARPPDIHGEGEVTIRDLLRNSLRMRPDRIVIGEVRGGEALDMLQAMNTGHEGSLGTIHANSPREGLSRLETLVLFAGTDLPARAIREQIVQAIRLIVQVSRTAEGRRRVVSIAELSGMEGERFTTGDIFQFNPGPGPDAGFHATGYVPRCRDVLVERGQVIDSAWFRF